MDFIISEKTLNLVMNKLAELPYAEVASIFEEVKTAVKPISKEVN